jgi:UDP-glucose 4-epimerase
MIDPEFWKGKSVLVTGGAGFIGSHLVEMLVTNGSSVAVVDNLEHGCLHNLRQVLEKIHFFKMDICNNPWKHLLRRDYDIIFHLAANAYVPPSVENPLWDFSVNLEATFHLLEVLRILDWPGKVIYASSAAVYGNPERIPICERDPTIPISPYGVGKLAAERYMDVYSRLYGLNIASMRFFSVYGPRQHKQVVYDLFKKLSLNPRKIQLFGDGSQVRDFNYVTDTAVAAMLIAEQNPLNGDVFNVASGRDCAIKDLVRMICKILNEDPCILYNGNVRPGDPQRWTVNIQKLISIGYQPQVLLEEGLMCTARWMSTESLTENHLIKFGTRCTN